MKTIIWKELRENLRWSALALLCLTLAEIYALCQQRNHATGGDVYNNLTVCSSAFLMVTSFGYSLVGAALGVVQILPELRRDQWAALLHRPVSRSAIFFGKVCAGLLLYFLATAPPLLASVAYAAAPGQFPRQKPYIARIPDFSDLPQRADNAPNNAVPGVRPSAPAQQQRPANDQHSAPAQGANPYGKLSAGIMNQAAYNLKHGGPAKDTYGSMHPVEKAAPNAPGSQQQQKRR